MFKKFGKKKAKLNPQELQLKEDELILNNFLLAASSEQEMNLHISNMLPHRSRLIARGTFNEGSVTLRLEKSNLEEELRQQFELVKESIRYFLQELQVAYPDSQIAFVSFEMARDYSHSILATVNGLDKQLDYRPEIKNIEEASVEFIKEDSFNPNIKGTFKIGQRDFVKLMNEHVGKEITFTIN